MSIQGYYLDGITSKRVNARLEVVNHQASPIALYIESAHKTNTNVQTHSLAQNKTHQPPTTLYLQYNDLKIESRLGNTPREITIHQQGLFVTHDNDGIDDLIHQFKYGQRHNIHDPNSKIKPKQKVISHNWLHRLESHLGIIALSVVVTITMMWGLFTYGIPATARYIAFNLPEFTNQQFGSSLNVLDKTLFDPSELNAERQAEIQALVAPYIAHYAHLKPKLTFRKGMGANAFALPSGDIIFTDDFVKITQHDDELLAVFFHELGHLHYKHMTRRALQDTMLTLVVIFITGDLDTLDMLIGLPTLLADLAYSREFEREADRFAMQALGEHNIPLKSFANAMVHLENYYSEHNSEKEGSEENIKQEKYSRYTDYLLTHPSTQERIDSVEALLLEQQELEKKAQQELEKKALEQKPNTPATH